MSQRTHYGVMGVGHGLTMVAGSFRPNGTSAPTVFGPTIGSRGWSVVRTSAGLFTITLPDAYAATIALNATLQMAAADDRFIQIGTVAGITAANGTVQIRAMNIDTGAVADVASNADNWIHFAFLFSNSSVNT